MKRIIVITLILLFYGLNMFSQGHIVEKKLPLLISTHAQFDSIIDSIIFISEKCYGKDLKFLTFNIAIKEISFNSFRLDIALIDCQSLYFLMTKTDRNEKPFGYFIKSNYTFILKGAFNINIFQFAKTEKIFTVYCPKQLVGGDYFVWIYSYQIEHDNIFHLVKFYQEGGCNPGNNYPICKD
jgi:hypothetical protein